jgi:hypothetical protein
MKCNEIRELLSLYIDRMLDENQLKEVEEHLSTCDACKNEYNEMKDMIHLLGQAEMLPVPDVLGFRLKKALNEEVQNRTVTGIIGTPSKKKNRWRVLTSVAAVFAVGVISFGLYHDVLGILPDQRNGTEQTEIAPADIAQEESDGAGNYDIDTGIAGNADIVGNTDITDNADSDGNTILSDDGSIKMKQQEASDRAASSAQSYTASSTPNNEDTQSNLYGVAGGTEPDQGDQSISSDEVAESEAENNVFGFDGEVPISSKRAPIQEDCNRSLAASSVERNAAAVQYYDNLIEEKLKDFDYQVLETCYAKTGEWQFRIFIFRGKDGNTYNEEILIIGKDGTINTIYSNE